MKPTHALAAFSWAALVVACSSGSAPSKQLTVEREPGTGSFEPGAVGPEPGATGPESGSSGGSSGSSSGSNGPCVACDTTYGCLVSGQQQSVTVQLVSGKDGKCFVDSANGDTEVRCGGTIAVTSVDSSGKKQVQITPWTPLGNGGFSFVTKGLTVQCTPEPAQTPTPVQAG